jgi:hypothetical protein
MGTITTKNIHNRFRHAINTLCECDADFEDFKNTFTEEEWYKFVSHMSGWVVSSLLNSEEEENSKDGI